MSKQINKQPIKRKLRKGDEVIVLAGRDKGRRGEILSVDPVNGFVVVQNVNQIKKHVRPNPRVGDQGGVRTKEAPMAIAKVAIYNPQTGKADRVGYKEENGKKVRVYKSTNEVIK